MTTDRDAAGSILIHSTDVPGAPKDCGRFGTAAVFPEPAMKTAFAGPMARDTPSVELENNSRDPPALISLTNRLAMPLPWKGVLSGKSADCVIPASHTFPAVSTAIRLPESLHPPPR